MILLKKEYRNTMFVPLGILFGMMPKAFSNLVFHLLENFMLIRYLSLIILLLISSGVVIAKPLPLIILIEL